MGVSLTPSDILFQLVLVVLQFLPLAFGFLLGYVTQILVDRRKVSKKRKNIAVVLALEILSILESAKKAIGMREEDIKRAQKTMTSNVREYEAVLITDAADYSTDVYNKLLTDLGLFEQDTVSVITELYRWVQYAHHHKRLNQQMVGEFYNILGRVSNRAFRDVEESN